VGSSNLSALSDPLTAAASAAGLAALEAPAELVSEGASKEAEPL
jgi:hypothetical protein